MYEKILIVTRKTRLAELVARFQTRSQAKFYIEHAGGDFADYEDEDRVYQASLQKIKEQLHVFADLTVQFMDRSFVSSYIFAPTDLVLVLGQDGLVANTAKYVGNQPIIGINPDPKRIDGRLVPIPVNQVQKRVSEVLQSKAKFAKVTLGQVTTNDGQKMLAFNDFFIGARTHVSARYSIQCDGKTESQSSSGILVSTGAGSSGWFSSVFNMVAGVDKFIGIEENHVQPKLPWDAARLMFIVREPFASKHSSAQMVAGSITNQSELVIESQMSGEGAIFSDGIEADFIPFNAGTIARVSIAAQAAQLVVA